MTLHYVRVRALSLVFLAILVSPTIAKAQNPPPVKEVIAVAIYQPTQMSWEPQIEYTSVSLRVIGPGGFLHDQNFGTGKPAFSLAGTPGDGRYNYELIFGRIPDAKLKAAIAGGEFGQDGTAADRGLMARIAALQATYSGSFLVAAGEIVRPDLKELPLPRGLSSARVPGGMVGGREDVVTADDAIIQGSLCVGFDCVNGESFGFDTIRLKENNLRIKFEDTSVGAFPSNDWQLTANDSASGGANKFSIEDITGAKVPFTVEAGAATNSIFVDSTGRVGLRTGTPVLDLHINTGNTPAARLEQNSSGGFTAQTWDVAGNEANFFIRDVTGGSRLPFRIRPGAPTSSIDIAADGSVGIGTASPAGKLHTSGTGTQLAIFQSTDNGAVQFRLKTDSTNRRFVALNSANVQQSQLVFNDNGAFDFFGTTVGDKRLSIPSTGVLSCTSGIKTDANGLLSCIVSSQEFKNVEGDLPPMVALANIMALRPQVGSYKTTPDEPEHWLIAEDVAAVDPALVGTKDGKPYTVKTQNIIADLIAVIQQQQRGIEQQQRRIEALERLMSKQ